MSFILIKSSYLLWYDSFELPAQNSSSGNISNTTNFNSCFAIILLIAIPVPFWNASESLSPSSFLYNSSPSTNILVPTSSIKSPIICCTPVYSLPCLDMSLSPINAALVPLSLRLNDIHSPSFKEHFSIGVPSITLNSDIKFGIALFALFTVTPILYLFVKNSLYQSLYSSGWFAIKNWIFAISWSVPVLFCIR